jgi:hypothetical protein
MGIPLTKHTPSFDHLRPEFVDGRNIRQIFGISRSHAYLLAAEGSIRSVSLRKRGAVRGRKLFDADSIRAYLARMAKENGGGHESEVR